MANLDFRTILIPKTGINVPSGGTSFGNISTVSDFSGTPGSSKYVAPGAQTLTLASGDGQILRQCHQ